jgi:hypothetical protein
VERTVYRVRARLVRTKIEADSDVHLVIADPVNGRTMIVEFPASYCIATRARDVSAMRAARAAFFRACGEPGSSRFTTLAGTAVVDGVGFFDSNHGQSGVALNAIELHPVLRFRALSCRST